MFKLQRRFAVPVALEPKLSLAVLGAGLCPREPLPEEMNVVYFVTAKWDHRRCPWFCRSPRMLPGCGGMTAGWTEG